MNNNYEGTIKREKMLSNFSSMIKPARLISNLSQRELADKSGLSIELIAGVENGIHRFHEEHYIALAAVFDNMKYSAEDNIYKAVLRILTPEDEIFDFERSDDRDFILVRRWFDSFIDSENENESEIANENIININHDNTCDSLLEDLAENYNIYVDTSAAEDENFPALVSRLEPLLRQSENQLSVPSTVIKELREDIETCEGADERLNIADAFNFLETKEAEGLIKICDCSQVYESFQDTEEVLSNMIAKEADNNKIAVITQDPGLAKILMSYNENIIAAQINDTGDLFFWR